MRVREGLRGDERLGQSCPRARRSSRTPSVLKPRALSIPNLRAAIRLPLLAGPAARRRAGIGRRDGCRALVGRRRASGRPRLAAERSRADAAAGALALRRAATGPAQPSRRRHVVRRGRVGGRRDGSAGRAAGAEPQPGAGGPADRGPLPAAARFQPGARLASQRATRPAAPRRSRPHRAPRRRARRP